MYLLHYLLLRYYALHPDLLAGLPPWARLGLFWLVLVPASHLQWLLVERPSRRWIAGLWPRASGRAEKALPGTAATSS